ncbi:MAG: SpoIID/LytB domain-containing protein [Myxococcaceae bacterium]
MDEASATEVTVLGRGLAFGEDSEEEPLFRSLPRDSVRVGVGRSGLTLDGAPVVGRAVRLRARGEEPLLQVLGRMVRGDVVVHLNDDALEVVNVIPLEDYVASVLAAEMPMGFPSEALKAQAVAVRTYALQRKLAAHGKPWHLGSTVLHQVYRGERPGDERARIAAEATRGEVLTWELAPIEAYFHSSCGGRTETGKDALSRDLPYLAAVDCPCRNASPKAWTLDVTGPELAALGGDAMRIAARSSTGRARLLRVGGRWMDGAELRRKLGYQRLKSLDFQVEPVREGVRIEGRGWGHGAGMCQWGARALAEQRWDYHRILGYYYPGTEMQRLY